MSFGNRYVGAKKLGKKVLDWSGNKGITHRTQLHHRRIPTTPLVISIKII